MKRLLLLAVPALVSGCAVQFRAVPPQPVVTAEVVAPPPPPAPASATVDVAVEPVQTGEPEEVTATTEPPDPVYEEQTDAPGPGYVWVGGYWGWNGADWGWNWGHWEIAPEGRVYIEPYYERVGDRVVYVHGYWGSHDAPRRAYGGEAIRFSKPERPANYHRGEHVAIEHRAGPPPGHRPGGAYVHASGTVRPVPHETVPHRTAVAEKGPMPRGEAKPEVKGEGRAEMKGEAKPEGRGEVKAEGRGEAKAEAKPEAKTDPRRDTRVEAKAEARPEPKSEAAHEAAGHPESAAPAQPAHGGVPANAQAAKAERPAPHAAPPANRPAPKKNEKK
ncbi:MAG: hypothetical protein WBY94_25830 [Polyangiaceae bacterium]